MKSGTGFDVALPFIAAGFVLSAWLFNGLTLLYDVRVESDGLSLVLFRILRFVRIPFGKIVEVKAPRFFYPWGARPGAINFTNRFFSPGCVLILNGTGLAKALWITPANMDELLRILESNGVQTHFNESEKSSV